MAKVFTVDVSKCNGCYTCQTVCKDEHCSQDWLPYAKAQPEIGQFWVKIKEHVGGSVPKVRSYYLPQICNHCQNPACVSSCSSGAIEKREDGLVIIWADRCTGCDVCLTACPYGKIYKNEALGICQKCTGCAHLLDAGDKLPRCVEACPTDALGFAERDDVYDDFIIGAEVWKPEFGTHPQVYYRNKPRRFIAGTVYNPEAMEVVIGAKIRAVNGARMVEVITNDFGDFWFSDLAPGKYDIVIEAEGFDYKTFPKTDITKDDLNLGDIPLSKKE